MFAGPGRLQADAALAMAVAVVLALFRVELHRGREPLVAGRVLRGADGLAQAEKIEAGGKEVGLAAELGGRVTVGVGDEGEAVQGRDEPVHLRVRGEAGLQGEDLVAQIAETLLDGVEPGLGAEQGKPRGPDVGRNEEPLRRLVEQNFEQVAGIQPEDGPAVRGDVAERGELGVDPARTVEVGQVEQVVDLAHPAAALVDGADLGREDKTDVRGAGRRPDALGHQARPVDGLVRSQAEEAGLGRFEVFVQVGEPARVGAVAGGHHRDPLDRGPGGQTVQVAGLAGGPRVVRMDVQVGEVVHGDGRQP